MTTHYQLKGSPLIILLGIVFFILLVYPLYSSSDTGEDWLIPLQKAEDSFQRGLDGQGDSFIQAVDEYQNAMEAGAPEDARIFYNWGNALYMAGFIPEAAFQYRKALYLKPGDYKIRENLSLALNRQEEDQEDELLLQKILFAPVFLIGYKEALYSGLFLFSLGWILMIANLFLRKKIGVYFLILFCLSLWFLSVSGIWHYKASRTGVILTDSTSLRKGDSRAYDLIGDSTIPGGSDFHLLEERRGWSMIRLENNREGWVETVETRMLFEKGNLP